ncbi:SMP-30/gluconolactonase/LRE family protein [Pseudozobellia thermophila]|uniref:Sugar lactone lactonase YvrE n=1 Tax=Pseudozobellia thermophila TaxID=192903 RepID=A0A1M6BFP5_9FLAO|nr:SMP-30/gluconolactonase/LRE family protein [Pseudozobellia thermophila]SHI47408.1 Sugar lactone lactonase YvrE [Pseudozobellia thermophila]
MLVSALWLCSCGPQKATSSDFTPEWGFTKGIEGPAVDQDGKLYAVNYREEGTIGIVYENGESAVFTKLPGKSIGNGIRFDSAGHMYVADYVGHTVYRIEKGGKKAEVYAHNPDMSQPNDLAIAPNGTIYLSDPNWAEGTGRLWQVKANKEIVLLEDHMGTTNGIEVSPDGKNLYVNESVQRNIWRYDIDPDGSLGNKTRFMTFEDFGLDGMRCDAKGNLYVTRYGKGTVLIVSPNKKIIKEVQLKGKKPSNITFGGKNGKTCFVTMADRGNLESFPALNPGAFHKRLH